MNFRAFIMVVFFFIATPGFAATIYLKDGEVEESDKVWEENGYIHFILKGTKRVEIRYAKEIVDRIEGVTFKREETAPTPGNMRKKQSDSPQPAELTSKPTQEILDQYEKQLKQLVGIGLYDPRRPEKYRINLTSHYDTFKQAIAALAEQYGHSPAWVISNMGEINDLSVIHKKLIKNARKRVIEGAGETSIPPDSRSAAARQNKKLLLPPEKTEKMGSQSANDFNTIKNIPFYNPRKPLKYWSDADTGHHTIAEAISAIAQKYGRSSAWVEENMGSVNDLEQIHRNLQQKLRK